MKSRGISYVPMRTTKMSYKISWNLMVFHMSPWGQLKCPTRSRGISYVPMRTSKMSNKISWNLVVFHMSPWGQLKCPTRSREILWYFICPHEYIQNVLQDLVKSRGISYVPMRTIKMSYKISWNLQVFQMLSWGQLKCPTRSCEILWYLICPHEDN